MAENAIVLVVVVLLVSYLLVKLLDRPDTDKGPRTQNNNKTSQNVTTIYPQDGIDIRALQAQRDVIVPTLEVDAMYLILDEMETVNKKVNALYNLKHRIDRNIGNRGAYLLDQVRRDGNIVPVPFNRKPILPTADFVGL